MRILSAVFFSCYIKKDTQTAWLELLVGNTLKTVFCTPENVVHLHILFSYLDIKTCQYFCVLHQFQMHTFSKNISVWENTNLHIAAQPCSCTDWKAAHPWPHCIKDSLHIIGCECSMLPSEQDLFDCCWHMKAHFMPLYLAETWQDVRFLY